MISWLYFSVHKNHAHEIVQCYFNCLHTSGYFRGIFSTGVSLLEVAFGVYTRGGYLTGQSLRTARHTVKPKQTNEYTSFSHQQEHF